MKRFKESQAHRIEDHYMRYDKHRDYYYRERMYYRDYNKFSIWSYIHAVLAKSIGKNIDEVTSKIIAYKKRHCSQYYYCDVIKEIGDEFDNHPNSTHINLNWNHKYTLDDQKRIQLSKAYIEEHKPKRKVYEIIEYGREVQFEEKLIFSKRKNRLITEKTHPELYAAVYDQYAQYPHWGSYSIRHVGKYGYPSSRTFITVRNDFQVTVSKEQYRKIHAQNEQHSRLQDVDIKRHRKQRQYSMLTREETRLKEEKEIDALKLLSHGFDDESFKGEHYHGQKRKKRHLKNES